MSPGDRVAQVIIEKITETEIIEVEDLNVTDRGSGGFGSTGIKKLEENQMPCENNLSLNVRFFLWF